MKQGALVESSGRVATGARRRPPVDKFNSRRIELAEATLQTLGELGYARTSLREIALKSEFTHGVLHYYFSDKVDLISCAVKYYKGKCVTRYDEVVMRARTPEALLEGFLDKLAETIRQDADMHRLWYDLRSQALFEEAFRPDVTEIDSNVEQMICRVASRYAELAGGTLAVSPAALYALFDGLFQRCLLRHLSNDAGAIPEMQNEVRQLLVRLVG